MAENKDRLYKVYGTLSAVAIELVVLVVISVFLGKWLESKFNLLGLAIPILIFLSLALWIFILLKTLSKLEHDGKSNNEDKII